MFLKKLELGVIVENCLCLAKDLSNIFEKYWKIANSKYRIGNPENLKDYPEIKQRTVFYNQQRPLSISNKHALVHVYIAVSQYNIKCVKTSLNFQKNYSWLES